MPGTGHSARYKGSISNRSKISPFEHLAKWNQQLLGADGAIPTIVGGNSLEFKKLDASDIAGVMTNPANLSIPSGGSLDMSCLDITQVRQLKFCRVNGGASFQSDELIISNNNVDGNIQIRDKPLKLRQLSAVGTTNQVDLILDSTSSTNNIELSVRGETTNDGKIFIGFEADLSAPFSASRNITIGHRASSHGGKQNINIGVVATGQDTINIGSASSNTFTNINAGTNLSLGSLSTVSASLRGAQTTISGTNAQILLSSSNLAIDASATVLLSGQTINVGAGTANSNVNIGTGTGNTNVNIGTGSANSNVKIGNINAGSNGSLTSETLQVTGTDRLNLYSTPGSKGIYIGQSSDKIGFLGASPKLRSAYGVLGPNLPVGASLAATVTMVQNIHDALVTVGLCTDT